MYNECRHIFTGGRKCQSPALRDQNFCYFHSNTRKRPAPANHPYDPYTEPKETALALTQLEDADAIQLALSEVVLALAANRIDSRRARILIYGLQVASQNQRHRAVMATKENIAETTVRETHEHEDGTLIGPAQQTPDPEEAAARKRPPSLGEILLREAEAMKAERDARRARGEEVETFTCTLLRSPRRRRPNLIPEPGKDRTPGVSPETKAQYLSSESHRAAAARSPAPAQQSRQP